MLGGLAAATKYRLPSSRALVTPKPSIPAHGRQRERRGFRGQDELAVAVNLEVVGEDLATCGGAGPGAINKVALAGLCLLEISVRLR